KFKFTCHWNNPFKDFEWSNVPRVKLSLFSESDDPFQVSCSLQALSNLHYFSVVLWIKTGHENSTNKSGCEMTVTIRDDRYWHAMSGDYFFDVQPCMAYMNKNYGTLPVIAEQLLDIKTAQAEETVPEQQYKFSEIKFRLIKPN
nr:hypothetical protein [Tanacetum cinerariifolium]